jgi:hypothetical protein
VQLRSEISCFLFGFIIQFNLTAPTKVISPYEELEILCHIIEVTIKFSSEDKYLDHKINVCLISDGREINTREKIQAHDCKHITIRSSFTDFVPRAHNTSKCKVQ